MKIRILLVLGVALGCARTDSPADTAAATKPPAGGGATPKPAPPPAPSPAPSGNWAVTPFGVGPVRAGMTVAEAGTALGEPLTVTGDAKQCAYARAAKAPEGLIFMVVDNHIARVDVRGKTIATVEGAKIGSSEARIDTLYQGRVTVQPHKYTAGGHYLVVGSGAGADTTNRIVFETDGKVVTQYRSGRMPEVGWVEGCS
jgi:hypothetical protein